MLKISQSLIVSFDCLGDEDSSILSVSKYDGSGLKFVRAFAGKEAKELYTKLTNKKEYPQLPNKDSDGNIIFTSTIENLVVGRDSATTSINKITNENLLKGEQTK